MYVSPSGPIVIGLAISLVSFMIGSPFELKSHCSSKYDVLLGFSFPPVIWRELFHACMSFCITCGSVLDLVAICTKYVSSTNIMCVYFMDLVPAGSEMSQPFANLSYVLEMITDTKSHPDGASVAPWPTPYSFLLGVDSEYSSDIPDPVLM